MITLTRCSSTPSAETFMNPAGSIRRTRPVIGCPPPQRSTKPIAGLDGSRIGGEQVGDDVQALRIAEVEERLPDRDEGLAVVPLRRTTPSTGATMAAPARCRPAAASARRRPAGSRSARASVKPAALSTLRAGRPSGSGLELVTRNRAGFDLRLADSGSSACDRGAPPRSPARLRLSHRGVAPSEWRRKLCTRPHIEQRRGRTARSRNHGSAPHDGIARVELGRARRPVTGAETTNRSRTRVSPSSSTVT